MDTKKARALMAQLTGDILKTHATDRRIDAATQQLHDHHAKASEGLGAAITHVRGSALEDAYLHHATEAHTARRLQEHRTS